METDILFPETEKIQVFPGQQVGFLVRDNQTDKPYPVVATVCVVHRGSITVPECESMNGLAHIVMHMDSENSGKFWYEYSDMEGKKRSFDVVLLQVVHRDSERRLFGPFIQDQERRKV